MATVQAEKSSVASERQEYIVEPESLTEPDDFVWTFELLGNVLSLCVITFTSFWAQLAPTSAIAFIAARFPTETNNANWVATAVQILPAVVSIIIGDASDIFGRRQFLLFGCALGVAGMLIAGCANTLTIVIGGQVMNGVAIGCGLLSTPTLQEIVPKKQRPMITAIAVLISSGSFIGAPIIEGVLIQRGYGGRLDGWRIGFYMGAAFWALGAVGLVLFYHPKPRPNPEGLNTVQQLRKFDWIGLFLASAAMSLFLVGINYGDNPYSWSSPMVLGPLVPGTVSIFIFILWEWKGTSTGLLPHAMFEDRNFSITIVIRIVGGIALFGGQAFLPQVAVNVFGTGGIRTAVWQLPFSVSSILGAVVASGLLRFFKEIKWLIFAAIMLMALGGGLCFLVKPNVGFVTWFFPSVLMGAGIGAENVLLTVISGLAVPDRYIATGVCIGLSASYLGGALATTIYGQVYRSKLKIYLPVAISNAAIAAGLPSSSLPGLLLGFTTGNQTSVPGATPTVLAAVQRASRIAYSKSFSYIWYVLIAWCALSAAVALLYGSTSTYMTNEVAAPVQSRKHRTAATQREEK